MAPKRIGVLGGTFDPVHVAHVVAAVDARHAARLDTVLFVVANVPWQKAGTRAVTPADVRYELVEAAVAGIDGLEPSHIEIDRGGESYTADTVDELAAREPGAELFVIAGIDVAHQLDTWHRVDDLRARAGLLVVTRPGSSVGGAMPDWAGGVQTVVIPSLEISGTDIRRRVAEGRPIDGLVPPA
ncbi:MAG: nicotinate-nucleotide adenylyltransferase, partial [Actinomycetota bacterium]|nr:nicotinate-nucleotide adenylyltransferase [Actinomycetota bacterium]